MVKTDVLATFAQNKLPRSRTSNREAFRDALGPVLGCFGAPFGSLLAAFWVTLGLLSPHWQLIGSLLRHFGLHGTPLKPFGCLLEAFGMLGD